MQPSNDTRSVALQEAEAAAAGLIATWPAIKAELEQAQRSFDHAAVARLALMGRVIALLQVVLSTRRP